MKKSLFYPKDTGPHTAVFVDERLNIISLDTVYQIASGGKHISEFQDEEGKNEIAQALAALVLQAFDKSE